MGSIEFVLVIIVSILTLSLLVMVVYLIITLARIRMIIKKELVGIVHRINSEIDSVNAIFGSITSIIKKIPFPIVPIISLLFYAISSINKKDDLGGRK
jgi:hypothetical protein